MNTSEETAYFCHTHGRVGSFSLEDQIISLHMGKAEI